MNRLRWILVWLGAGSVPLIGQPIPSDAEIHFDQVVAPVLAGRCLDCHAGSEPKGKLDLSGRESAFAVREHGPVIAAGSPQRSLLWQLVSDHEMPPKHPLPEAERKILRDWIAAGAEWGTDPIDPFRYSSASRAGYDWWSLQPLKKITPPRSSNSWAENEIDHFVLSKLQENKWKPSPRANSRTLVRRLYNVLLGLPAPVEVIERFARDPSPGQWTKLVDELLSSPHYGERWARHWMDVARFGESGGYEYNKPRENAWPYRDWLIRAFNEDLPYDQFARMQLAGDLLKPNSEEGAAAVGFLVAGVHNDVLGQSAEMKMVGRQDGLEEIASTVGQAFLGMTVHCARCHDHKFDPITAREYYQFVAALDGVRHGTRKVSKKHQVDPELPKLVERKSKLERQLSELVGARGEKVSTNANIVELKNSIEANEKGIAYRVTLKVAPTVWAGAEQSTRKGDGILMRIVKEDGKILSSRTFEVSPWGGGKNAGKFVDHELRYVGDGRGPVRIWLEPAPLNSGRFGGAVDEVKVLQETKVLFSDGFQTLKQLNRTGKQADTGRKVFHSARSDLWTHRGVNALHAEDYEDGQIALQLFAGTGGAAVKPKTIEEKTLQSEIEELGNAIKRAHAQASSEVHTVAARNPGAMRVHERGDVRLLGDEVAAAGLSAIVNLEPSFALDPNSPDVLRRTKLAEWISAQDNSLFHRVVVNRVWHHHFGQGLVLSPNDFGFNGGRPSHPELIDWLAGWFREHGYSLKKLHRLILTSATWQQSSSSTNPEARRSDGDNRLLWRQNARRVDAETFRDSVLAISGTLNREMYGPGFKDVRIDQVPPAYYYVAIDPIGPQFNRRTIYRWHVRGQRSALLDTFDCPDPSVTAPTRSVTTTPSQALSQWNHPFILRMSKRLAERVEGDREGDVDTQVIETWRLVLGRMPDRVELVESRILVRTHGLEALARALFNSNEFIWID